MLIDNCSLCLPMWWLPVCVHKKRAEPKFIEMVRKAKHQQLCWDYRNSPSHLPNLRLWVFMDSLYMRQREKKVPCCELSSGKASVFMEHQRYAGSYASNFSNWLPMTPCKVPCHPFPFLGGRSVIIIHCLLSFLSWSAQLTSFLYPAALLGWSQL